MINADQGPITAGHYGLIRVLLGIYLVVHFLQLIPYGTELFSSEGLLPAELSPLIGILPNLLAVYDSPLVVTLLLVSGVLCGVSITLGMYDRVCGLLAAVVIAWLFARNPLIANPSMPVVGWMLVVNAILPRGAYSQFSARGQPERWARWFYPRPIWIAGWVLLAVAYSYSGYTKLLSPSWIDGSAIRTVLENPLARDHFWRLILLDLPPVFLSLLTWAVLVIELLFIPLCFWAFTRKWAWLSMLMIQLGFLFFLDFADLTFPMLLIHALTFDRRWLDHYVPAGQSILFYDGSCGFCNGLVRFALSEDLERKLKFGPLGGKTFTDSDLSRPKDDSIVLYREDASKLYKSDAAIYCMQSLGGVWLLLGTAMKCFPRAVRDFCYDFIGRVRYKIGGNVDQEACPLLPPVYASRMLP